jgi:hypothetical protein
MHVFYPTYGISVAVFWIVFYFVATDRRSAPIVRRVISFCYAVVWPVTVAVILVKRRSATSLGTARR